MSLWHWIVLASAAALLTKLLGYAVPARVLHNPRMPQAAACMPAALVAALRVVSTFSHGQTLVLDARLAALGVAALALWLRTPFLLVVVLGAVSAAVVRWLAG